MIELNKIYNEDCLETMKRMPDNFIDLTVTSPPYDNLRDYRGYSFDFKKTAKELLRVTKRGGVVVWVVADATIRGSETGTSFKQALYFKEIGFNLHDTMIYKSVSLTMNHPRYEQDFEYMFVFSKGPVKTFNPIRVPCIWYNLDGDRLGQKTKIHAEKNKKLRSGIKRTSIKADKIKGNIWNYSTGKGNSTAFADAFSHPAIFPEALTRDHIISWSNEEDIVLDPFCGSGTTPDQAILLNRNYIGIEVSQEYCDIANKRIKERIDRGDLFRKIDY